MSAVESKKVELAFCRVSSAAVKLCSQPSRTELGTFKVPSYLSSMSVAGLEGFRGRTLSTKSSQALVSVSGIKTDFGCVRGGSRKFCLSFFCVKTASIHAIAPRLWQKVRKKN